MKHLEDAQTSKYFLWRGDEEDVNRYNPPWVTLTETLSTVREGQEKVLFSIRPSSSS